MTARSSIAPILIIATTDGKGSQMAEWQPIGGAPPYGKIIIGWYNPDEPDGLDDIDIADSFSPSSYFNGNGNLVRRIPGRAWPTHFMVIPSLKP